MAKALDTNQNCKQKPGSHFNQASGELIAQNAQHEQEVADSRDHDKQSGKTDGLQKPGTPSKKRYRESTSLTSA
jgi:hypothetical protein